jgi:hypothetical protein
MAYQIQWHRPDKAGGSLRGIVQLEPGASVRIGREAGNDILLPDGSVSRLHAELYSDNEAVYVVDSSSHNGTRLDGQMIVRSVWRPGQKLSIGPFLFELALANGAVVGQAGSKPHLPVPPIDPAGLPQVAGPAEGGRIKLDDVYRRAKANDAAAVRQLFSGFLSRGEQAVDCGYLGALGFIWPEHSFWCVTPSRVCGMMINASGLIDFQFGFLKALNVAYFHQPSLVKLWLTVIAWCVTIVTIALLVFAMLSGAYPGWVGWLLGVLILVLGLLMIPWVIRAYYRYAKSGCVFFTKEHVPICVFADRQSLKDAQRFISVYAEQKRALE